MESDVNTQERIEELEQKLAFLERAVEELSDALRRQQLDSAALRVGYEQLLRHVRGSDGPSASAHEIPPHY
jgi:uncharacterized coiled-coil protein SlyX